jgi:Na+/melibiose symporter-like transporter
LVHEFVSIYGKCGLVWDENELQKSLQQLHQPEKFRFIKNIGRWLKDQILAAVLIGSILAVISTILVFYTNKWLGQPQEKIPPQSQSAKVTPE